MSKINLKVKVQNIVMRHNLMRNEDFETIEQCVDIADNYAVEFAKWILRNFNNYGAKNEKELLEIYKNEKTTL